MHKPEDYKHIRAWGNKLGSFNYYIVSQQNKAAKIQAPVDTIYFDQSDKPVIASGLKDHVKRDLLNYL